MNGSDIAPARGDTVKSWTELVSSLVCSQATDGDRPRYYDGLVGGKPGVQFFSVSGDGRVLQSASSLVRTGDMTIAVYCSDVEYWHHTTSGSFISHGLSAGAEVEDENETYDLRCQAGVVAEFHENGVGVNNFATSTIVPESRPGLVVARRTVSTKTVEFDSVENNDSDTYTNDPTGGTSGRLALGAFSKLDGAINPMTGNLLEVVVYDAVLTDEAIAQLKAYFANEYEQRNFTLTDAGGEFTISADPQSVATDGSEIWVAFSDRLERFNLTGTSQDSRDTTGTPLTSWGGCYLDASTWYLVRFDTASSSRIYSIDSTDLSGGSLTLVKTLSDLPHNGVNGITKNTDGDWLVGRTDAADITKDHKIYRLNSSFEHQATYHVPVMDTLGIQSLTFGPSGELYANVHDIESPDKTTVYRLRWTGSDVFIDWHLTLPLRVAGIVWDETNSVLYAATREGTPKLRKYTLGFQSVSKSSSAKCAV